MKAISASDLLAVWEEGNEQSPVQRALTLLHAAYPAASLEALGLLSIGRRDACLLSVREQTFGRQVSSVEPCPACGENVEVSFQTDDIRVGPAPDPERVADTRPPLEFRHGDYALTIQPPSSLDLVQIAACDDLDQARRSLIELCVLEARRDGQTTIASALPGDVVTAIVERLEQADPQANVELALRCPACGHQWLAAFDVAGFLWAEIESWAISLLGDVHILASAYGWREADILAMGRVRREMYLEMARP